MTAVLEWASRHRKMLVGVAGFVLTFAIQMWGPDNPWVALAVGVATVTGIWRAPNRPAPAPLDVSQPGRPHP